MATSSVPESRPSRATDHGRLLPATGQAHRTGKSSGCRSGRPAASSGIVSQATGDTRQRKRRSQARLFRLPKGSLASGLARHDRRPPLEHAIPSLVASVACLQRRRSAADGVHLHRLRLGQDRALRGGAEIRAVPRGPGRLVAADHPRRAGWIPGLGRRLSDTSRSLPAGGLLAGRWGPWSTCTPETTRT